MRQRCTPPRRATTEVRRPRFRPAATTQCKSGMQLLGAGAPADGLQLIHEAKPVVDHKGTGKQPVSLQLQRLTAGRQATEGLQQTSLSVHIRCVCAVRVATCGTANSVPALKQSNAASGLPNRALSTLFEQKHTTPVEASLMAMPYVGGLPSPIGGLPSPTGAISS